jgi:hypothetical protein
MSRKCSLSGKRPPARRIQDLAPSARYSFTVESASPENTKSDVQAKTAFCEWLLAHGYSNARISASPADVVAHKDGRDWLFEVKFTKARRKYFGAATLTEWSAAAEQPEHFRFVVAYQRSGKWVFDQYTPDEFMAFSYVPPIKIYFNVPLDGNAIGTRSEASKRVYLTKRRLRRLSEQFQELRKLED